MKTKNILFVSVSFMFFYSISYGQKSQDLVDGWFKAGSTPELYEIGRDENVKYNEVFSYYLKSIAEAKEGFGTIMKYNKPVKYIGTRLKLTGYIKTENIDGWAGMWMRVDGDSPVKQLQFDNMGNRPIKGTNEWTKYEIVLDVPEKSTGIYYGVLIEGNGEIWLDNLTFEIVSEEVPSTNMVIMNFNNDFSKLPQKLENIPDGIEIMHTPDSVLASMIKDDTLNYYWFHKTSVKSKEEDLEITEFGSYLWNSDHWELRTVTGKPFSKKDFEDWYNCKDGKLIKKSEYTDKNNWYRLPVLQYKKVLWYYLGKNQKGEIFKGSALIEYLPELKKK